VVVGGGPPAKLALGSEKRFHDQDATWRNHLTHPRHPGPVKIIEHQNRIKTPELGPGPLQVRDPPLHGELVRLGELARGGEPGLVPVNADRIRAEQCRGHGVAAFAAGQIEHPHPGPDPMSVPEKPGAGAGQTRNGGQGHARSSVRSTLEQLTAEPADLLVIGGGITGAGVARDAAMRGLRTVLVDQHDFGSGTSSRSSRLVHGGLRYLETGDLRLVLEANRERRILLRIAPHLVWPLAFVFYVLAANFTESLFVSSEAFVAVLVAVAFALGRTTPILRRPNP